jgi:hypothetical protein
VGRDGGEPAFDDGFSLRTGVEGYSVLTPCDAGGVALPRKWTPLWQPLTNVLGVIAAVTELRRGSECSMWFGASACDDPDLVDDPMILCHVRC